MVFRKPLIILASALITRSGDMPRRVGMLNFVLFQGIETHRGIGKIPFVIAEEAVDDGIVGRDVPFARMVAGSIRE